jgi:hypothetical protein
LPSHCIASSIVMASLSLSRISTPEKIICQ